MTLVNRDGLTVEVADDVCILDAVEATGTQLPVGCRYGACITCAARLLSGAVDQSQGVALKPQHLEMGFVLLCVARPRADCWLQVGVESQAGLFKNPFKGG